jgi:hypothetical protein
VNQTDDTDQKLARLIDRALHELPPRHAPPTLESRVVGALMRRVALPWWRQNFAHWPGYARTLFFAVCGALIGMAFAGSAWIVAGAGSVRAWHQASAVVAATAALSGSLLRAVPPAWLYEGAAVAAVLYALLFALGAAAYRTLWADP